MSESELTVFMLGLLVGSLVTHLLFFIGRWLGERGDI
jgi:hypothetical protein